MRAPGGSVPTGSRQISTFVTSTLSSAQPVTGIAPATPAVLSAGVSKLPKRLPIAAFATFTWIVCGEFDAAGAVMVTIPLGPATAVTVIVALPVPDVVDTVMFDWLEEAVHPAPLVPVNVSVAFWE